MKFNLTHKQLKEAQRSVYSQAGQDGVLEAIFNQIGHGNKMFIDIGARDGLDISNTANLRLKYDWGGLLIDYNSTSPLVWKLFITVDNINEISLFDDVDLWTIDIDGNEFWLWDALTRKPKVICMEFNSKFSNDESYAIKYNPEHKWDGTDYYSASLLALKSLGERKGYTLVHVVENLDAFFIRNDLIDENYIVPTLDEIFPEPIICFEKSNKEWVIR